MHLGEVLYVPRLKKNLISVAVLESKGYRVVFMEGKALLWSKGKELNSALVIGHQEGGLYKFLGQVIHVLVHVEVSPSKL